MSDPKRKIDEPMKARTPFAAILVPLSLGQFLDGAFENEPLHLSGTKGRFEHLLSWNGLARLLETHALEPPRLCIIKAGQTIPGDRYLRRPGGIARLDGGALSLLLDAGATAIINHVDDLVPAIAELADAVGDALGARTAVNLYATWRSDHGFDPHWDHHDVIILQLGGRKRWPIFKPTRPNPLRGNAFEAPPPGSEPDLVETLEDGDCLYLPRGWIHAPSPLDEPSLHLTIAITRPTGAGFLEWLASELRDDPEVRAALPLDGAALAEWRSRMAAIIDNRIGGGTVDRYLAHTDAERGARPRFSFPDFGRLPVAQWKPETLLRPASGHRLMVTTGPDGSTQVTATGRAWPCSAAVAAALSRLTSTHPLTLGELEAGLGEGDRTQLRQMLALLTTFGLLAAA